jgi:hypothetical protein
LFSLKAFGDQTLGAVSYRGLQLLGNALGKAIL